MSGRYLPIGQIMPSSQNASTQPLPKFNTTSASDSSFQSVLNRQQQTSAELKSQVPQYSQYTMQPAQQINIRPKGIVGTSPLTQSQNLQNFASGKTVGASQSNQDTQVIPPEAMDMVQNNVPDNLPDESAFDRTMVQNLKDYQAMQQKMAAQPPVNRPMLPTAQEINDASAQNSSVSQGGSSSAFNSAFGHNNNAIQPGTVNSVPQFAGNNAGAADMAEETDADSEIQANNSNKPNMLLAESREEGPITNHKRRVRQGDEIPVDAEPAKSGKRGLFGNLGGFFQDIAAGITFGAYHPEGEEVPTGAGRVFYPIKKLAFDAPIKDIALGIPGGIYNDVSGASRKSTAIATAETASIPSTSLAKQNHGSVSAKSGYAKNTAPMSTPEFSNNSEPVNKTAISGSRKTIFPKNTETMTNTGLSNSTQPVNKTGFSSSAKTVFPKNAISFSNSGSANTSEPVSNTGFSGAEASSTQTEQQASRWRPRFSVDSDRPVYAPSRRKSA